MDKNNFDLDKIKAAADELGIELTVNSDNPGIHFMSEEGEILHSLSCDRFEELVEEVFGFKFK